MNHSTRFRVAEVSNMITEQAGTHVAKLVLGIMVSFRFFASGALAIAASFECDLHDYEVIRLKHR